VKLYLEDDKGNKTEVTSIEQFDGSKLNCLLMRTVCVLRDKESVERELSEQIGIKVVILPMFIDKVIGV
jgi:hypothetical protein